MNVAFEDIQVTLAGLRGQTYGALVWHLKARSVRATPSFPRDDGQSFWLARTKPAEWFVIQISNQP